MAFSGVRSSWLMLARKLLFARLALELSALRLELPEQPRVLDGQRGLAGEGLQQVHDLVRERSHRLPPHGKNAEDALLRQERYRQDRANAIAEEDRPDPARVCLLVADVGHLDRLAAKRGAAGCPFAEVYWLGAGGLDQLFRHPVARLELEFLGVLVVLVDHPAGCARELHRAADDRRQDGRGDPGSS